MNLIKRIKNIWRLSGLNVTYNEGKKVFSVESPALVEESKPRLAQIIKRKTPAEEFLKENNNE